MTKEVIAALIGAAATIVAAGMPLGWLAVANRRAKHLSARRSVLLGRWEGEGKDYYVESSLQSKREFTSVMTFTDVDRSVKAEAHLQTTDSIEEDTLSLSGMFYNDDYLQLSYSNKNLAMKQLGVVVLGLKPDGTTLVGYYTGFSPRRETIVAGTITLRKKP